MSNPKITWRFEDSNLWFCSEPSKFLKHVARGTKDLEVHPDTKIIFSDDLSRFLAARFFNSIHHSDSLQIQPVPEPTPTPEVAETLFVSGVSDPVDRIITPPTPIPTPTFTGTPRSRNLGPGL